MGLDQYAFARKGKPFKDEDGALKYPVQLELAYWRKHPNLQGWMEELYRQKGGTEEFNCVDVELTEEDLDSLEAAVKDTALPETSGFFFGNNGDDHYREQDLKFIEEARQRLKESFKIVYTSWW